MITLYSTMPPVDWATADRATALIVTLQEAVVPFEMMLYPGYTHRVAGPKVSLHRYQAMLRFLAANGVPPGGR